MTRDIGDRSVNLIFIGQEMNLYKDKISAAMDSCLVDADEWAAMLKNKLTQEVEDDPFAQSVFPEDQGN